ncbi:MAG: DNA topoisomerase VI subunit B [bacterium]
MKKKSSAPLKQTPDAHLPVTREPDSKIYAVKMAEKQRDISVSEFFLKNRHLLGFDNPKKALLTTVKEGVDNSLDACEEAKILPDMYVEIKQLEESRFRVIIRDNGPGIVRDQIPKIFGKLLYGSKFHTMKQSRGQQGIGISSAGMYGQLTTGKSIRVYSRISPKKPTHHFEIYIDTSKNMPVILTDEIIDWEYKHGTQVEIELEAKYIKGHHSVDDYLKQVAIANPHVNLTYINPENEKFEFKRASQQLPKESFEIKPHPHGVELGILMKMLKSTRSKRLKSFLSHDFSRVSPRTAAQICRLANLSETSWPSRIAHHEADNLYKAINQVKLMNPPTNCISPIGESNLLHALKKELKADFFAAITRPPSVYRGNPFQIEAAVAYGGGLPKEELVDLMRFANRVPLLYQQSACAISKSVLQIGWKSYGLEQSRGALPTGPAVIAVHMASVWVPFTSESKEAIASYPEIIKEIRLALQDCGRKLSAFIKRGRREADANAKRSYIESYIPHVGIALREILNLTEKDEKQVVSILTSTLEKKRSI